MKYDLDLWPDIIAHGWKWQTRTAPPRGIVWHATRSGIAGRTAAAEWGSTVNWFRSPNNRVVWADGVTFAGMSNLLIAGGQVAQCVPLHLAPRYSAGVHDFTGISIEVGQATADTPYDPRDITLCREVARELAATYGFELGRLPYLGGDFPTSGPAEVGHEDTAQGRGQGKSDPGPLFWQAYLDKEDEMDEALRVRVERIERILAGNGIDVVASDGDTILRIAGATGLTGIKSGQSYRLTGEPALRYLDADGASMFLGLGQTQAQLRDLSAHVTVLEERE